MAMLAEPRRRQRIGPNPRGNFFCEDEDNRGRTLLQKLGWKNGDGLGVQKQGISEPIRPKIQMNANGLGFNIKSDPWMEHSKEFSDVLENLQAVHGVNANSEDIRAKLETKSKHSRSRIHYHKFTRGKDLSNISSKDWTCLFGNSIQVLPVEDSNSSPQSALEANIDDSSNVDYCSMILDSVPETETSESITEKPVGTKDMESNHINMGSMEDYFKNKMAEKLKACQKKSPITILQSVDNLEESQEIETAVPKKTKKRKHEDETEIVPEITSILEETTPRNEILEKKKIKKRKQNDEREVVPEKAANLEGSTHMNEKLEKKKKEHKNVTETLPEMTQIVEETTSVSGVLRKSRKHKDKTEVVPEINPPIVQEPNSTNGVREKKKKHREETEITLGITPTNGIGESTKKRKRKHKNETEIAPKIIPIVQEEIPINELDGKKKRKHKDKIGVVSETTLTIQERSPLNKILEKKKKKKHKNPSEILLEILPALQEVVAEKKKKHKNPSEILLEILPALQEVVAEKKKKHKDGTEILSEIAPILQEVVLEKKKKDKGDAEIATEITPTVEEITAMNKVLDKKKIHFLAPNEIRTVHSQFKGSNLYKIRGYGMY